MRKAEKREKRESEMKNTSSKENQPNQSKKIVIGAAVFIISVTAVIMAVAVLVSVITHISFVDALQNKFTYVIGVCLIIVGILAIAIDLRVRGSKRVLKVNADLENSHFMTRKEMLQNEGYTYSRLTELYSVDDGMPLMAEKHGNDIDVIMHRPIHTLVIGATGTGKTVGFVSPTIEILSRTKTKPSMVVTDPKGELFVRHKKTLEEQGYKVTLIDLSDVYHSTHWNPFNDIVRKTEKMTEKVEQKNGKYYYGEKTYLTNVEAEQAKEERVVRLKDEIYVDLQDLVYTAFPVENKQDMTWQRGARDLIFALTLSFWEDLRDGYMPKEKFNLYNLYRNVTDYAKGDCEELKEYFATREDTSRAKGLSNTVLVSEDRTLSSYLGDVNQYMNWLADGGIAALTSENEIEFSTFDEQANILFIKIPDARENRHKLVALLLTQMYKALVEKADNNREFGLTSEQKLLRNVYFIMDEFGNIPRIEKMASIITVGRGRGIFAVPVIQDFNQLDTIYGKETAATIRNNCNIQIFIGSNDENTRRIFSEACGKKKVKQVSYSENKDMSVSTSAQSVPLIYPNELEKLNDPPNGKIGNSIVQCLGNYPIKAVTTPIFKAQSIYKTEDTLEKLKDFTFFDEQKAHYDIVRVTALLTYNYETDFNADEPNEEKENQVKQVEQYEQAEQHDIDKSELIQQENNRRVAMQLRVLKNKISEAEYSALMNASLEKKVELLNDYADNAAERGNLLFAAEIEKMRAICKYALVVSGKGE